MQAEQQSAGRHPRARLPGFMTELRHAFGPIPMQAKQQGAKCRPLACLPGFVVEIRHAFDHQPSHGEATGRRQQRVGMLDDIAFG